MLCMPGIICDTLNGVTQATSVCPSTSTLALPGCEENASSLSSTAGLGGTAFLGWNGDFSSIGLPLAAILTVLSGAICVSGGVADAAGDAAGVGAVVAAAVALGCTPGAPGVAVLGASLASIVSSCRI